MVSLQWLEPSEFVSDEGQWLVVQMFVSGSPPLALISQLVCHNCLVPGFTDGAGFCVVTMS